MLYLAQVQTNSISGEMGLKLLAHQHSEYVWEVTDFSALPLAKETVLCEGVLVLVEIGEDRQIISIQEATDWILTVLQQHLTKNAINPQFIEAEQNKVEQWRQEITAQNLELNRRALEIETRREQLQELEQDLKRDREELARQQEEFKNNFKQEQVN